MRRPTVSFEWQVAEDEAAWEAMALDPAALGEAVEQDAKEAIDWRIGLYLLRLAAIGLASIVLVAGVGLTPEERDRRVAITGIQAVLAEEAQAAAAAEGGAAAVSPPTGSVDTSAAPALDEVGVGLVRVEPMGEITLAEVVLTQPLLGGQGTSLYRETRFYRKTEHGWRQTTPGRPFWGQPLRRETAHLRFEFFARDAATVEPLLGQLEAIYLLFHRLVGLSPSTTEKLVIEITPERVTGRGLYEDRLRVTSPIMSQIPNEFSATTFLAHQIVSRMVTMAINSDAVSQAIGLSREESFSFRWRAMRRGLRSWLQTELLAQAWPWDRQATELFLHSYREQFPLLLDNVVWGTEQQLSDEERMMWQSAAAESIVAYTVETYGRKHLPVLLRGLHQYSGWQELLRGGFNLSVEEFEAGWNRYLSQQAALAVDVVPRDQAEP